MIYFYSFHYVSYRVFIFLIIPVLAALLFYSEITKKFFHKNVLYNLLLITLICGISNTVIQLIYSQKVHELQIRYIQTVASSEKTILIPEIDLANIYFAPDNIYFCQLYPSMYQVLFSKEYKQTKLVVPCTRTIPEDEPSTLKFDLENNVFCVFFTLLNIKNKFWDLTEMGELFVKNKDLVVRYNKKNPDID